MIYIYILIKKVDNCVVYKMCYEKKRIIAYTAKGY